VPSVSTAPRNNLDSSDPECQEVSRPATLWQKAPPH
jgi:hypothetical protein